jgi:kynureninase
MTVDETVRDASARLVGALPHEVVVMNSLTVNLHLLMAGFYRPPPGPTATGRHKILIEDHAFPSDTYAVKSQILLHGRKVEESLVLVRPREGEETIRTEDVVAAIKGAGDELALVMLSGVQYYTGQLFDIPAITAAAHAAGAYCGWDCAHAAGNAHLRLHDWDVDFAAWCGYKYLNR